MDQLTEDEVRAELRRAVLLGNIAENAGEPEAASAMNSLQRALEHEMHSRRIG